MFEKAVLILGGNKGDRITLLKLAVEAVSELGELTLKSKIYETEAWGGVAKGPFLNQVVEIETSHSPFELLAFNQKIETDLGRKREEHWGDRTMDIDIIYFGDSIIDTPELRIPHPFLAERKFVLVPLVEILPDYINPILGKSNRQLLEECENKSEVKEFEV
ncbi:2-amino-4-hydroxy-6-hydroxymethyldihydropteridine diphosphokinase [Algoriphagus sp. D3-2-R+10]|uniref:2-amino-4-hydroxy-6- hydroxymethyldihydropteridine diphosphokinase n=1 Tax=Algoriphagus aurantiacus TaxID=3103948 RepID=UPI002B3DBC91|nr:2-amino-4-hydroxy-6-hydroxymethyldihydropteridine diphosphokinase [Algoriphagus sp. D3-2-R+10]MEB2774422.1 2-amino-4-hydroxy-6-hydroxymethyldihydropteridine diphosphokinase [Algoriphagus sp. D3-2-R+10]